jgi:formylmethanofuran dehydrogenase subunit D
MNDTKLVLIPGRTLKQGTGMNIGKESGDYQKAVTTIEMNRDDMGRLGVEDGDPVRIKASGGEATVHCRGADLPEGIAFIAYGPVSSELMDQETHGSGMPDSKGFEVEVKRVG